MEKIAALVGIISGQRTSRTASCTISRQCSRTITISDSILHHIHAIQYCGLLGQPKLRCTTKTVDSQFTYSTYTHTQRETHLTHAGRLQKREVSIFGKCSVGIYVTEYQEVSAEHTRASIQVHFRTPPSLQTVCGNRSNQLSIHRLCNSGHPPSLQTVCVLNQHIVS